MKPPIVDRDIKPENVIERDGVTIVRHQVDDAARWNRLVTLLDALLDEPTPDEPAQR